jgi:hypothetical protein
MVTTRFNFSTFEAAKVKVRDIFIMIIVSSKSHDDSFDAIYRIAFR